MSFKSLIGVAVALSLTAGAATAWGQSPVLVGKTQLGSSVNDYSGGVAVDSAGNVYITGKTGGSLFGISQGANDAFVAKFGSQAWKTQLGSSNDDGAYGVAIDNAGNAYITGYTYGSVFGTERGGYDAFLAKYSSTGSLAWKTQLGSPGADYAQGVAVDSAANVYVTGYTGGSLGGTRQGGNDAFLAKYDATGNLTWKIQLGTSSDDYAYGVAVDGGGNAYITGRTGGSLGGTYQGSWDAFLAKFDSTGSLVWKTQLGSAGEDYASGVAVDSAGSAYITGATSGGLSGMDRGVYDAFLVKYDSTGNLAWKALLGSSLNDYANGVALDNAGNPHITGYTVGSLGGANHGGNDAFLAKYDSTGNLAWVTQFGSSGSDIATGVAVDSTNGIAYVTGYTDGSLGGPNQGGSDAFLVKYDVPEPATLCLLAIGGLAMLRRQNSR